MAVKTLAIEDFELFSRLAQQLSVAGVARERNVAASQVSRDLSRIEAACGLRLFHRSTHGLSLTAEGHVFFEHAQQICRDAEALADDLSVRSGRVSGLIRISVSAILAERVLAPSLSRLMAQHPDLRVALNITDRAVDMASEGVDVAVRGGLPVRDTLVAKLIGRHRRKLYAAPAYLKACGVPETIAALKAHRLISNSAVATLNQWHFQSDGQIVTLPVKGDIQADNTDAMLSLALAGVGIARINDVIATPYLASQQLVSVLEACSDPTVYDIHAITLAARHRAPKIRATVDWLQRCLREHRFLPGS